MKTSLLSAFSTLALGGASLQAAVLYGFDDGYAGDGSVHFHPSGVAGWTQNIANPVTPISGVTSPIGYISSYDINGTASNAGVLGTLRGNHASGADTVLTGALGGGAAAGYGLSLDFGIVDNPGDQYPTRDSFSIAVTGGSSTLATVSITPDAGDDSSWVMTLGGDTTTITTNAGYVLFFNFLADSVEVSYGSAVSGDASTVLGSIAGDFTGETLNGLVLTHTPAAGVSPDTSANALVFDNVTLVPEPGTTLLFGLAALGLLRRRRA